MSFTAYRRGFFVSFDEGSVNFPVSIPSNFNIWGIERSGFFNGREKWAKGFENQRV